MKRITNKQLEIMQVLWKEDRPLTASEIVKADESLNINTVQVCIRQLLKCEYIKVADIVYSGTVLCRSYAPVVTRQEYVDTFFRNDINSMSAALSFIDGTSDESLLDELEKAIDRKRKTIKKEK